jgi:DsbC/DsbD-like thiol-disulfide interchange protein
MTAVEVCKPDSVAKSANAHMTISHVYAKAFHGYCCQVCIPLATSGAFQYGANGYGSRDCMFVTSSVDAGRYERIG